MTHLPMHPEDPAIWRVWGRAWAMLRPAAERSGTHEADDVLAAVVWTGKSQLWVATDAAAVTEIVTTPRAKILFVWLAGGALETLREMFADAERWGREAGCDRIQINGRAGWERALPGLRRLNVALVKEL